MKKYLLWVSLFASLWWIVYGGFYASELIAMHDEVGRPIDAWEAARRAVVSYWVWVPMSVGLFAVVAKYPFDRRHAIRSVLVLGSAVLAVILVRAAYVYLCNDWLPWYPSRPAFAEVFVASFRNNVLQVWMIVGVAHAFVLAEHSRNREMAVANLQRELTSARLAALSAQLNPHFLFNALNSIAELVHHDAAAADRMLVSLAALLRKNIETGNEHESSLRDELGMVDHYLAIQKLRLSEKLLVQRSVERECWNAAVPVLLLQTLVENAVIHSIARRSRPGRISITVRRAAGSLVVEIDNDGPDLDSPRKGHGVGLANATERLRYLYGDRASLTLLDAGVGAIRARLELPFRPWLDGGKPDERKSTVMLTQ